MRKSFRNMAAIGASLILGATGCTLKATINQTTDTTSNITGTTSGAAWWSEDGQIKPDFKTTAFVSFNHENLRQDLAAGRGEYLVSMSTLLGVPEDRQPAFFSAAQASYAETIGKDSTALLELLKDTSRPFVR
ncbi:MAG: DUF3015 domain-containing protein [Nitrospira sp. CG24B]|nr:MAG: DUF3015 domain-containing protein [Nitrospira sp. CG24B]